MEADDRVWEQKLLLDVGMGVAGMRVRLFSRRFLGVTCSWRMYMRHYVATNFTRRGIHTLGLGFCTGKGGGVRGRRRLWRLIMGLICWRGFYHIDHESKSIAGQT